MAYEIELTIGNRTYHYGSLDAYREDMIQRRARIAHLSGMSTAKNVTPARRHELYQMVHAENVITSCLDNAATDFLRTQYA